MPDPTAVLWISGLMALAALLYTSVGHAGASAYLAIMALFAVAPETMRPVALVLNVVVASFASVRYLRAGQMNWRLVAPLAAAAAPMAFLAARVQLPGEFYRPLVGVMLWLAAVRLLWPGKPAPETPQPAPRVARLATGGVIGVLSGLTGTGGGVFLSPIVLLLRWETPRKTSGVAAVFILCVSAAGLLGNLSSVGRPPPELPFYLAAVLAGAIAGTQLGIRRLSSPRLLQALAAVLTIAGAKLALT